MSHTIFLHKIDHFSGHNNVDRDLKRHTRLTNTSYYTSVFQPSSSRGTSKTFLIIWRNLNAPCCSIYSIFREPSKELVEPLGSAEPRLKNTVLYTVWKRLWPLAYNSGACLEGIPACRLLTSSSCILRFVPYFFSKFLHVRNQAN